jgi:hypothetical protein
MKKEYMVKFGDDNPIWSSQKISLDSYEAGLIQGNLKINKSMFFVIQILSDSYSFLFGLKRTGFPILVMFSPGILVSVVN